MKKKIFEKDKIENIKIKQENNKFIKRNWRKTIII